MRRSPPYDVPTVYRVDWIKPNGWISLTPVKADGTRDYRWYAGHSRHTTAGLVRVVRKEKKRP